MKKSSKKLNMTKNLSNKLNLSVKVFIMMLLIFLIASGSFFIHYGTKMKNRQKIIYEDDNQAGQFMMILGMMGLLANIGASIMLGYYWDSGIFTIVDKMIQIIFILFTLASNVILIIYGLKIYENLISDDNYKLEKYIVILGALCVICGSIGFIYFSGLLKIFSGSRKKKGIY